MAQNWAIIKTLGLLGAGGAAGYSLKDPEATAQFARSVNAMFLPEPRSRHVDTPPQQVTPPPPSQPQTIVVHSSNSGNASSRAIVFVAVAGGGYMLYWTYVRGNSFSDLFYVTRASFKAAQESINTAIQGLSGKMQQLAEHFHRRVQNLQARLEATHSLTKRANDHLDEHGERLSSLQDSSRLTAEQLSLVSTSIQSLEFQQHRLETTQQHGNQGIGLLCRMLLAVSGHQPEERAALLAQLRHYIERDSAAAGDGAKLPLADEEFEHWMAHAVSGAPARALLLEHSPASDSSSDTTTTNSTAKPRANGQASKRAVAAATELEEEQSCSGSSGEQSGYLPPDEGAEPSGNPPAAPWFSRFLRAPAAAAAEAEPAGNGAVPDAGWDRSAPNTSLASQA